VLVFIRRSIATFLAFFVTSVGIVLDCSKSFDAIALVWKQKKWLFSEFSKPPSSGSVLIAETKDCESLLLKALFQQCNPSVTSRNPSVTSPNSSATYHSSFSYVSSGDDWDKPRSPGDDHVRARWMSPERLTQQNTKNNSFSSYAYFGLKENAVGP